MKKLSFCLLSLVVFLNAYLLQAFSNPTSFASPYSMGQSEKLNEIIVDNRVLARVHNHPISVIDVKKQMDSDFYIDYPHLMDSVMARFQFYKARWRPQFERMVESELIYEEAKEHKIEVSDGDIRREIEAKYGPEVILNIDKVGLNYDDVWDMVKKEIMVQRMTSGQLYIKGVFNVPPKELVSAYENYITKNKKPNKWKYYMVSFKGPNAQEKALLAKSFLEEMSQKSQDFNSMALHLKDQKERFGEELSVSNQFELTGNQIQPSHRDVLNQLKPNCVSEPLKELSRISQKPVYRLFYLTEFQPGGEIKLSEVENKLLKELRQTKFEEEYNNYVTMLKERNGITKESVYDSIPNDFEPFKIK